MQQAEYRFNGIRRSKIGMKSLISFFTCIFILFIITLPSGYVFGINVKMISLAAIVILSSMFILKNKKIKQKTIGCILISLASYFFIIVFALTGKASNNNDSYVLSESMLFLSFFVSCMFLYINIIEKLVSKEWILKSIFWGCVLYSIVKIFLVILFALNIIPISLVVLYLKENHGIVPMMMQISGNITRFQLANDFIVCFLLYLMTCASSRFTFITKFKFNVSWLMLLLCVIISFSRYMFMVFAISIMLKFILSKGIGIKKIISIILIVCSVSIISLIFQEELSNAIDIRFNSSETTVSDSTRNFQTECLYSSAMNRPISGNGGMGSFNSSCSGPEDAEYSYEVQYLGYAYKFGFIATAILIVLYISQMLISVNGKMLNKENIPITIGLLLWIIIGAFNPYLVSAYASVIMTMFVCCVTEGSRE